MKLGVTLPLSDIGGDPATVRVFAEAAEAAGYDHLAAPDHVLGVNVAMRPGWGARNTSADLFHDPFVLFGFSERLHDADRLCDGGADPAAAPNRAGRQAGRFARHLERGPVSAGNRDRLERSRIRWPQRGFSQSGTAVGRAGASHAGFMGGTPCEVRGEMASYRRRRESTRCRSSAASRSGSAGIMIGR